MKKVGIMTWYQYHNYGTALQAAALFHEVECFGYEPSLIQYPPRKTVQAYFVINMRFLMRKMKRKLYNVEHRPYDPDARKTLFVSFFQKHTRETPPCPSYPELYELNSKFDAFVCGSDQIWSPDYFDEKYFLSFIDSPEKIVAYAPSIGRSSIADSVIKDKMKMLIARIGHLSVRESQGAEMIASLCGKKAEIVLDPTLLLDRIEWDNLLELPKAGAAHIEGKYILCYFLGEYRRYRCAVQKISKALHVPAYVIPAFQKQKNHPNAVPFEVGPAEFVRLIQSASYVCTDSFHGLAFALNFNIPFTVFKRFRDCDPASQNSRIYSLLELTGLRQRLTDEKRMNAVNLECDFAQANRALSNERKKSLDYLQSALENACGAESKDKNSRSEYQITELCCGCGACVTVCPVHAVSVRTNAEGFEHYVLDEQRCIRCGMCRQVCPYCHITATPLLNAKKLYSFKSKRTEVLKKSSSGGAACEIAELASNKGYWVCGSAYRSEKDGAEHLLLPPENKAGLSVFQGSKYLQSSSVAALAQIASFQGKEHVAFFGTPCQTAALDKILRLRNRRDTALLVDLICHGVPTRLLWEKYLRNIEGKYGIPEHPEVLFRSAKGAWGNRMMEISGLGHTYLKNEKKDDFYVLFRHSLCNMRTCYECPYREKSAADLRVGDYWGPRFTHDKNGVSMVIAITDCGKDIVRQLAAEGRGTAAEEPLEEYWNVQFPQNPPFPLFYNDLLAELKEDNLPLEKIRVHYAKSSERYEILCRIARILKNKIKG